MKRYVFVSLTLLVAFTMAVGKPKPGPSAGEQPPEALKSWGFVVGDWEMESKRYSLDGPVIEENSGQATFAWEMQGLRLEERQTTTLAGRDMLVLNLFVFHPEREEWEIARTDSLHHSFSVMRGTNVDDRIVLLERNPNPESDVVRRVTYSRDGEDRFSRLLEFSLDTGETWVRRNETFYTRRR